MLLISFKRRHKFSINARILSTRSGCYTWRSNTGSDTLRKWAYLYIRYLWISIFSCFVESVWYIVESRPWHVHYQFPSGSTADRVNLATATTFVFRHEKVTIALETECTVQILFLWSRHYNARTYLGFEPTLWPFGVACRAIFLFTSWKFVFDHVILAWSWDKSFVTC